MNEYQKLLHEIESKKQDLESRVAEVVQIEISKWQSENHLAVRNVYIDLEDSSAVGESKRYEVSGVSIDLDYKP